MREGSMAASEYHEIHLPSTLPTKCSLRRRPAIRQCILPLLGSAFRILNLNQSLICRDRIRSRASRLPLTCYTVAYHRLMGVTRWLVFDYDLDGIAVAVTLEWHFGGFEMW